MSLSVVQICNLALKRIGIKQRITLLTDTTQEAAACNAAYDQARDYVLDLYAWPFANRWAVLTLDEEEPNDDWGYSYQYPTGCVKVRRLVSPSGRLDPTMIPFELGSDADENILIYTDQELAEVKFTALIENPAVFSPSFANSLIWCIAAELAMPLSVTDALRDRAVQYFRHSISEAAALSLNEGQSDPAQDSDFTRARE